MASLSNTSLFNFNSLDSFNLGLHFFLINRCLQSQVQLVFLYLEQKPRATFWLLCKHYEILSQNLQTLECYFRGNDWRHGNVAVFTLEFSLNGREIQ